MKSIIEGLYSLFCPRPEEEDAAVPYKAKLKTVGVWLLVIIFCMAMLMIFLD